jgi:hypothetical protein
MDALPTAFLATALASPPSTVAAAGPTATMAGFSGLLLSTSIVAALITGTINLTLARRRSRDEERARVRTTFAEAFKAYSEYREFPNAIVRRDTDRAAEERQRLFEGLRQLDARLSFYRTWALLEAPDVGAAYEALLREAQVLVDKAMRVAWSSPLDVDDVDLNLDPGLLDPTALGSSEQAFRDAVAAHLRRLSPRWVVRG